MPKTAKIGMVGHAPTVLIRPASETPVNKNKLKKKLSGNQVAKLLGISDEQQKYLKCWRVDSYRNISPGERCVLMFLDVIQEIDPKEGEDKQKLIDFGCGTGRAAMKLDETFSVIPMDFAINCLDKEVKEYFGDRFVEHDITKKTPLRASWGFCTDVMEHLPTEDVDKALDVMFEVCDNVFFQIATIPDHFGGHPDIQEQLHLTVWDYHKWLKKFTEYGVIVHRSKELNNHVIFMVSGYEGFAFNKMAMNTSADIVWSQMRENLGRGLKQLCPFGEQLEQKVIVLGGSPSLNDFVDEIREHKKNGAKIVTMNGTYKWAKDHGLWPVTQFMIDARPFNARFIEPVDDKNIYIIASQCHSDLLDKLPEDRTYLYQCNLDEGSIRIANELLGEMYKDWFPIPGGSTVMLRCLPALQMIGFRDIECYGFDSCFIGEKLEHHAYEQKENDVKDKDRIAFVTINERTFPVEPWMLCQAKEFVEFKQRLLRPLDIKVHGDGLIAHCLETGVDVYDLKE